MAQLIWLVKHPISKHYKETQKQVKALARNAEAKIFDVKFADRIDPALVGEHGLTPIDATDESDEPSEEEIAAAKEAKKAEKAAKKAKESEEKLQE